MMIPEDARLELITVRSRMSEAEYLDHIWASRYPGQKKIKAKWPWPWHQKQKTSEVVSFTRAKASK